MITEKDIEKINEYSRRVRAGEILTEEEIADRTALRNKYRESFRRNLGLQLDSMKIQRPDGTLENVKDRKKS